MCANEVQEQDTLLKYIKNSQNSFGKYSSFLKLWKWKKQTGTLAHLLFLVLEKVGWAITLLGWFVFISFALWVRHSWDSFSEVSIWCPGSTYGKTKPTFPLDLEMAIKIQNQLFLIPNRIYHYDRFLNILWKNWKKGLERWFRSLECLVLANNHP